MHVHARQPYAHITLFPGSPLYGEPGNEANTHTHTHTGQLEVNQIKDFMLWPGTVIKY